MSNSPAGETSAAQAPQQVMRRKKEITIFSKNPSRPFQLQAMQKAKGISPSTSAGSPSSGTKLGTSRSTPRATPLSQSGRAIGSPGPSSTLRASTSMTSVGTSPSSSQKDSPPAEPDLPFQEFSIVSTDRHGWRYDVMRFDSRKPVDINAWNKPVKLNRKELRRPETNAGSGTVTPVAVGPMLGPDGKPVIGADGRIVMVDAEGKPIHEAPPSSSGSAAGKGKDDKDKEKKKKKFQKKTRQVFLVPDHIRQLRREERYPWIMEDASGSEVWEGRMEDASKAEMHGLLMPAPNNVFKFVPAHRWYKFQKKLPQKQQMTLEEAEKKMAERQKGKELGRWAQRTGMAPLAGGIGGGSLVYDIGGGSLGPGGRRLRTVDNGMRGLFGDDDDDDRARRQRERDRGAEGDVDEMEYEEDFADDEEPMVNDGMGDEEAKELEERLKREYKSANKTREGYVDESEEEEDDTLSGAGKDMKKLVQKIEKNAAYDSDDEKNPYASSDDEEEEEEQIPQPTGPAVQEQANVKKPNGTNDNKPGSKAPSQAGSRSGSPAPSSAGGTAVKVKTEGSPPPTSPTLGMGGHSIVAKRATSPPLPKAPKLKPSQSGSRATSPLAGSTGSRAGSPNPPALSPGVSRASSPSASTSSKKRKAEEGAGTGPVVNGSTPSSAAANGAQPKLKKRKPGVPGADGATTPSTPVADEKIEPGMELTAELLVRVLKSRPGMKTRECIQHFQPILTEERTKHRFTELVKEVATLKNGMLVLKAQYREGGVEA